VVLVVVAASCINRDDLYLLELSSNTTSNTKVRFGYFGKTAPASFIGYSLIVGVGTCVRTQGIGNFSTCVAHVRYDDDEPLAAQFSEELTESTNYTANNGVSGTLDKLLPVASRLQTEIFPAGVPVAFLTIFLCSTIVFWILVAASSSSKGFKAVLAGTTVLNGYGLTLGFMAAYATRLACKSLLLSIAGEDAALGPEIVVTEGSGLQYCQWAVVALSCLLQLSVASLFIRRRMIGGDNVTVTILPPFVSRLGGKRRRCC
jgi:hypothetical protein